MRNGLLIFIDAHDYGQMVRETSYPTGSGIGSQRFLPRMSSVSCHQEGRHQNLKVAARSQFGRNETEVDELPLAIEAYTPPLFAAFMAINERGLEDRKERTVGTVIEIPQGQPVAPTFPRQ